MLKLKQRDKPYHLQSEALACCYATHSDVAPFGRSDAMCSLSRAKYASRSVQTELITEKSTSEEVFFSGYQLQI